MYLTVHATSLEGFVNGFLYFSNKVVSNCYIIVNTMSPFVWIGYQFLIHVMQIMLECFHGKLNFICCFYFGGCKARYKFIVKKLSVILLNKMLKSQNPFLSSLKILKVLGKNVQVNVDIIKHSIIVFISICQFYSGFVRSSKIGNASTKERDHGCYKGLVRVYKALSIWNCKISFKINHKVICNDSLFAIKGGT